MVYKNIPNILSAVRILLSPIIFLLIIQNTPSFLFFALLIFILGGITDALDGYIARKFNLISSLGKFLDPLSDKLFVLSAFVSLYVINDSIHLWMIGIIVFRDVFVTIIRVYSHNNDIFFKTSYLAKAKTFFQMFSVILIIIISLINVSFNVDMIFYVSMACAILTLLSGLDYLKAFLKVKNG